MHALTPCEQRGADRSGPDGCGQSHRLALRLGRNRVVQRLPCFDETHRAVGDGRQLVRSEIERIILVQFPRCFRPLLWQHISRTLDIAGAEVQHRLGLDPRMRAARQAGHLVVRVEIVDQPAGMARGQVAFQRPAGIRISEGERHIRHAFKHHALINQPVGRIDAVVVHVQLHPSHHGEREPGSGDDDVSGQLLARSQCDALGRETLDRIGDDFGIATADGVEQIGIGHQADALVPRIVGRLEIALNGVAVGKLCAHAIEDGGLDLRGLAPRITIGRDAKPDALPLGDAVGERLRQMFVRPAGDGILRRACDDIGRRTLQHGDLLCGLRHRGHQRHRRRAAADHDHALARIIQIVRPLLRVDDLPPESLRAFEMRRMAARIIIIAAAHVEERAGDMALLAILLDLQRPLGVFGGPARRHHLATEANMPVDPEFLRGVDDVIADRLAIGDGLIARPGVEGEAQRVHVRIRADTGITE